MSELLPCPFCGGEPLIHDIEPHSHAVQFGDFKMPDHPGSTVIECFCGCGLIDHERKEVIARWNRRAFPATPADRDAERDAASKWWAVEQHAAVDSIPDEQLGQYVRGLYAQQAIDAAILQEGMEQGGEKNG